jgi:signal recognition particle receptor subunit beta
MAQINLALREVNCKVVYYGPARSGKTTNLEKIHAKAPEDSVGELVSLSTEQDRTLLFDFLPLNLGAVAGMTTKFQLYTVPGQVYYNQTRKLVLQGADGVVFVADSSRKMVKENLESLENLIANLKENGLDIEKMPLVLQWNKRDLEDAVPASELNAVLNRWNAPTCEAVAFKGEGVFPALKLVAGLVIKKLNSEYGHTSPALVAPAKPAPAPAAAHPEPARPPAAAAVPVPPRPVAAPHPPAPPQVPAARPPTPAPAHAPAASTAHPAPHAPAAAPRLAPVPVRPAAPAMPAAHAPAPAAPAAARHPAPAPPRVPSVEVAHARPAAAVPHPPPPPPPPPAPPAPPPEPEVPAELEPAAVARGDDNNPIRRAIERRRREASENLAQPHAPAAMPKPKAGPPPPMAIKSIQKSNRIGVVLLIVGIVLAVAVVAVLTAHFSGLVKLF